jgi:undecaprenyl-diphosphatase
MFEVTERGLTQGGFSFPSSHAVDAFCIAAFVGQFAPNLRWPLFIAAVLMAYSRVYCGAHFPSDVLAGAVLGCLMGWLMGRLSAMAVRYVRCLRSAKTN